MAWTLWKPNKDNKLEHQTTDQNWTNNKNVSSENKNPNIVFYNIIQDNRRNVHNIGFTSSLFIYMTLTTHGQQFSQRWLPWTKPLVYGNLQTSMLQQEQVFSSGHMLSTEPDYKIHELHYKNENSRFDLILVTQLYSTEPDTHFG